MKSNIDKEELSAHLAELEKISYLIEKPINYNNCDKTNKDNIIEFLLEEMTNTRKNASKIAYIAKNFYKSYELSFQKVKLMKKKKNSILETLESTLNKLDTTEKSAQNYEEKVEYLTREIEDLEITLRDTLKDKEKTKRELEQFKRMSKEKHVNGANSNEAEKKSLIYYKEESARKIAEIQAESSRKSDIIEEMTQRVKVLENKLSAEKHNAEALRTQIHNLKNDMFNLHTKIIDLKTKKSSIESKLSDLEQELIAEKEEKVSLNEKLMKLVSTNDDKSQNSLCEMEVDDLTLDITNPKLHPKRTEILSDFFDLNEDFKEEEFQENNEKLVYFISSPTFSYPKTPNLTFSFCDSLSVLSLKPLEIKKEIIHKGPKTSDEATYDIDNIYKYNNSQEYLDFKNPTKECFIKICRDVKNRCAFRDQAVRIPTQRLFNTFVSQNVSMDFWRGHIEAFIFEILGQSKH